ncbi:CARDB domain-containing protein [Cyanobacterium sp. DS4]|uniref:CARDB domain-containing protein n=1 Tax=Cyanobacterium sp. DS4 TaxID=2878255 RepID=UPI002E7FEEE9|nr:CARDB domain-containing protein [Cyanobacterium sp. Dongsha4]WVL01073.1 hypothetical protein Dongsha4_02450 [Cyanobacterium sp. Dongsha4]
MAKLFVANTITDLILGDIDEHLPINRIPLSGTVLGLGTTTATDNGELVFLPNFEQNKTSIYKCNPTDGKTYSLSPTSEVDHFPYVCFTNDIDEEGIEIDVSNFNITNSSLTEIITQSINQCGVKASYYGVYIKSIWSSVVLTIASKLCLWQWARMKNFVSDEIFSAEDNIYTSLQHFYCADQEQTDNPMKYLGKANSWQLIGMYASEPKTGLVTVPQPNQNLHIHGICTEKNWGGHVHHEHKMSKLLRIDSLIIYPLQEVEVIESDLTIKDAVWLDDNLVFTVVNQGLLDVSNLQIHIVPNNQYSSYIGCRIPWLSAGNSFQFNIPKDQIKLKTGKNLINIIADPDNLILEANENNNILTLEVSISPV